MSAASRELPPRPLPLLHVPHKLPRTAGAARTVAPTTPFVDPAPVLAAVGGLAHADHDPETGRTTVRCSPEAAVPLSLLLARVGVGGLRMTVRLDGWPVGTVTATHVRTFAEAGVAALAVDAPTGPSGAELPHWFELSKAALAYGLPLHWSGDLPVEVREHARHLMPARDDLAARADWRYGMLIWRRGPGFAIVEDAHDAWNRRQLTLDLSLLTAAFGPDLDHSASLSDIDPAIGDQLVRLRLAAVIAERLVFLPFRMRRWPVTPDR